MPATHLHQNTYTDIELPGKLQLRKLPLRSLIAYACRCVRRVQRFYTSDHASCVAALDRALDAVESYANGGDPEFAGAEIKFAAKWSRNQGSRFVASAVSFVAQAALIANESKDQEDANLALYKAWMAAATAYNADPDLGFVFAARDDYDYLSVVCEGGLPETGSPIDAGENGLLGPLWGGRE